MTQATAAAAVIAAINAQFSGPRAYDMSDPAVKTLATDHVLVTVSRRYVPDRRESGEVTMPGGRVMTRYVARTVGNVYELRRRTTAALEDQILPGDVGPFTFESDETPGPDEGWVSGADVWIY